MRLHQWLPISLLFACGDDANVRPDAGPRVDAPKAVDAAVDADESSVDAPVDAPPTGDGERVWVVGDVETNATNIAVGFDHTTPLPVTAMTAGIVKLPAMGEIFEQNNNQSFSAEGGKIAFVADATMTGRFDIYVANADGSSPTLLVTGQMGLEFTSIALSPDGTKLAFLQDSVVVNGGYDLYLVATTNPQAPVRLSPDRGVTGLSPDQDVFTTFTWSADSKYVSFSADIVESSYDMPYIVDTTAAMPAPVALVERAEIAATMSRGVRGAILFDSANNVYFRAHLDDTTTQFKLYKATTAGSATRTALALPMRTDQSTADVTTFGITPDGTKIVFSADAPSAGTYNLYVSPLDTFAPTALTTVTPVAMTTLRPNINAPLWFSPDGTKVAVVANWAEPLATVAARSTEGFVVALDGSTQTPRRVAAVQACPAMATCSVDAMQWTPDGATIYFMGDIVTTNDTEVYKVPSAATDPMPTLVVDLAEAGDATNLFVRPL